MANISGDDRRFRDDEQGKVRTPIQPAAYVAPTPSREPSPEADTHVEAGRSVEQLSHPHKLTDETSKERDSSQVIEDLRSWPTKNLLFVTIATTASMGALGALIGRDVMVFAEGLSAQPPVITLSALPLLKVFTLALTDMVGCPFGRAWLEGLVQET